MKKIKFTIFTPTYNREKTLHRVYNSLRKQISKNFEWLIIDDGSTDSTYQLVQKWQKKSNFNISYYFQKNSGKYIARNEAIQKAKGEFFITLDSDDACVENALEKLINIWKSISDNKKNKFAGIICLTKSQNGLIVGDKFPKSNFITNFLKLKYLLKIKGEKWVCLRTEILKKYLFETNIKTKFLPEGIVWSRISRDYDFLGVNIPLRIYYQDEGNNQLTKASPKKYSVGLAYWHKTILNTELDFFINSPLDFFKSGILYARFSFHNNTSLKKQFKELNKFLGKLIFLSTFILGYLVYLYDIKYKI